MAAHVPVVPMDRGNNTTCTINLHGATIVSWRVNNQVMSNNRGVLFYVSIPSILPIVIVQKGAGF